MSFAQLCTEDGATLWHANQADNIDEGQLRELAYRWNDVKQAKLDKIAWPDAAHLASRLLDEDLALRPATWDKVLQHPFLAAESGTALRKQIVMSCPEMGTLDLDSGVARVAAGTAPEIVYDQQVMTKVAELQKIGFVKLGFDRAGTSTARKKDEHLFEEASALRNAGRYEEAVALLKSTDWWYGYQTSVKQAVKLEAQGFDGELGIICIKGGFITQLEAAEMGRIMTEATADCLKSGIDVRYKITEVSFYDFLSEYEPVLQSERLGSVNHRDPNQSSETNLAQPDLDSHGDTVPAIDSSRSVDDCALAKAEEMARVVAAKDEELAAKDEELAAKDEELAAKDEEIASVVAAKDGELAAKDEELAAMDEELKQLRAQLERLEGVPPQRPDKDV